MAAERFPNSKNFPKLFKKRHLYLWKRGKLVRDNSEEVLDMNSDIHRNKSFDESQRNHQTLQQRRLQTAQNNFMVTQKFKSATKHKTQQGIYTIKNTGRNTQGTFRISTQRKDKSKQGNRTLVGLTPSFTEVKKPKHKKTLSTPSRCRLHPSIKLKSSLLKHLKSKAPMVCLAPVKKPKFRSPLISTA